MKRILISWIGGNDLDACTKNTGNMMDPFLLGPLMSTCRAIQFSEIHLMYNYDRKKVKPYLAWLNKNMGVQCKASFIKLSTPIAFEEIYLAADKFINEVVLANPGAQLSILLSPGSPAMQAVSILLGKTKYSVDFIQSSIQQGIQEITLPFDITAEFIPSLKKQQDEQLKQLVLSLPADTAAFDNIITKNKKMQLLIKQAAVLAQRDVPVLIYGETGTGKELFAKAIRNSSLRRTAPFEIINCGAIPPELIDSTLFGYVKGAFTGADKYTPGLFEQADTGTVFLDEFGELTKDVQVRLLRVLDDQKIKPVGSNKEKKIDVRIIAATNKNLTDEIIKGHFREDLFYRVAVGVIKLPPLRERTGDLQPLSKQLLEQINTKAATQPNYKHKKLSTNAINVILNHSWPGNVRELYSTLLRASLWSTADKITDTDIKDAMFDHVNKKEGLLSKSFTNDFKIQELVDELQVFYIKKALKESNDNLGKSAKLLGLSNYQTLSNLMKKYDVQINK